MLCLAITELFAGSIALVSSFGTESAVLLDLAAEINRAIPVIFLDTGKLFPETLSYRDALVDRLGLTDVRVITPASLQIATHDANGTLWRQNADRCCTLRKTLPLQAALGGFSAWITGRKRFQAKGRDALPVFEREPSGARQGQPAGALERAANRRVFRVARFTASSVGSLRLRLHRLRDLHASGGTRRGSSFRTLARQGQTECGIHLTPPAQA